MSGYLNEIQPLDSNKLSYFLTFNSFSTTPEVLQIEKPLGLEKAVFQIKQNEGGYGRHLTFADNIMIGFNPRNDEFKKLYTIFDEKGAFGDVVFEMKINGLEFLKARLKMETAQTDYVHFFDVKINSDTIHEQIQNKKTVEVDLVSNKTADNVPIQPIVLEDVLTRYKEIKERTEVVTNMAGELQHRVRLTTNNVKANLFTEIVSDPNGIVNIGTKVGYLEGISDPSFNTNFTFSAQSKINVIIKDVGLTAVMRPEFFVNWQLFRRIQTRDSNGNVISNTDTLLRVYNGMSISEQEISDLNITMPANSAIYYAFILQGSGLSIEEDNDGFNIDSQATIKLDKIDIFDDTITKCARLGAVGEQILKSITNNAVTVDSALFYTTPGRFWEIFCTNGLYLRQFNDQPFIEKWDNFLKYIRTALNCDYQVVKSQFYGDQVFLGHETDFYKDLEIARIEFKPTNEYKTTVNKRLLFKEFTLKYSKYEDDKDSLNTTDSVHRSISLYIPHLFPIDSDKKSLEIPYIADDFKIEYTRRESFKKDQTKTIPNDKDIYVIDTIENLDNSLMNRSNEGFDVSNFFSPETCYNLRLSTKRLLFDNYSETMINTAINSSTNTAWAVTDYDRNKTATTQTNGLYPIQTKSGLITEGNDILKSDLPSVSISHKYYEIDLGVRIKFNDFIDLANKILYDRGYITFYQGQTEVKLYISELQYNWEDEQILNVKGERKI